MKTYLLVIVAAVVTGLGANTAAADGGSATSGKPAMHGHHMGGGMFAALNLTDDQKAKVKGIMTAAKATAAKATDRAGKMQAFKDAFTTIKTTVLTDDQRKKLETLKAKFGHMRRGCQKSSATPTTTS